MLLWSSPKPPAGGRTVWPCLMMGKREREKMKKGDRVTIYQDVTRREKPEGVATLIRRTADANQCGWWEGNPAERWLVRFDGDDEPTGERTILIEKGKHNATEI